MTQRDEAVLAVGVPEAARRLGLSARTVATLVEHLLAPVTLAQSEEGIANS